MNFDPRRVHAYERFARATARPPSLLQKIVAFLATLVVFGVALMFSVLLFAVVATVGVVAWGYLWWRTRELRRRMRDRPPGGGVVIEGEVIREVDSERRER